MTLSTSVYRDLNHRVRSCRLFARISRREPIMLCKAGAWRTGLATKSDCFALNRLGPGTSKFVSTLPGGFESRGRGELRLERPTTGDVCETAFAASVLPLAFDDGLS